MADRNYRGTHLQFIDANPATDAYQTGRKIAEQEIAQQIANEYGIVRNAEQLKGAPTRLRTLEATADQTRANADVAVGTVQPRISQQHSAASLAGTQAH